MDIQDYSQNWIIDNKVKVTFFSADHHHKQILGKTGGENGFTVAPLLQIAQLKAVVACSRSKSRDWADLFFLEKDHQFGLYQWKAAYKKAGLTPCTLKLGSTEFAVANHKEETKDSRHSCRIPLPSIK